MNHCEQLVKNYAQLIGDSAPYGYGFLGTHARVYTAKNDPRYTAKGIKNQCYRNAQNAVLWSGNSDLVYVEGYAMKPSLIPLPHAFILDRSDGKVIDPTWEYIEGTEYFGVAFNDIFLMEHTSKTGFYGVFEHMYVIRAAKVAIDPRQYIMDYLKNGLHSQVHHD